MSMIQLIYASQPLGFDVSDLRAILVASRQRNERDGVTGALICRADLYLQLLEGPQEAVEATFARISRDRRHVNVKVLSRREVGERLFPKWAMRDDPVRSWMWTQEEVNGGAVDRATPEEAVAIFERLAGEIA